MMDKSIFLVLEPHDNLTWEKRMYEFLHLVKIELGKARKVLSRAIRLERELEREVENFRPEFRVE